MARSATRSLTADFVRKMLAGHSALGLTAAAVIYVICLSGTVAVFYQELERWEQPNAPEFLEYTGDSVNRAATQIMAVVTQRTPDDNLYVSLPTHDFPRMVVSIGETGRLANESGALQQDVAHDWTHFLLHLHIYLHLDGIVGLTLVGIAGAMLFALIASGLLAHPNIFKDAFFLRWGGSPRLAQTDLHNRLSVWGAPFHLAISITGAYIGLSSVVLLLVAAAFYSGDEDAAGAALYGPSATLDEAPNALPDLAAALANVRRAQPTLQPTFIVVEHPGTRGQRVVINADVPRRLVYAERFELDPSGIAQRRGLANGPIGKQIYASVYPVHFGSFGGLPIKIAYLLMGLALSVVTVTGVNIWLEKRRQMRRPAPRVENLWAAVTWGVPIAISASAVLKIAVGLPPTQVFWVVALSCAVASYWALERDRWSRILRDVCAVCFALVPIVHIARFGNDAFSPGALVINLMWTLFAIAVYAVSRSQRRSIFADNAKEGRTRRWFGSSPAQRPE